MKTSTFGPGGALIGSVTAADRTRSGLGAVIWGLGLAEVLLARRLARFGIESLQVRISGEDFNDSDRRNAAYDTRGIELCRAAMDKLTADFGTRRFLLMGNCATGNLCFNTAQTDRRTAGVIITNPYFSGVQKSLLASLRNVARRDFWRRALQGRVDFTARLHGVARTLAGRLGGADALTQRAAMLQSQTHHRGDIFLPVDFDGALQRLCERGVKVLLVCTRSDDSLQFLSNAHLAALNELQETGGLRLEIIERSAHVFNEDEFAAELLNDSICDWTQQLFAMPRTEASSVTMQG